MQHRSNSRIVDQHVRLVRPQHASGACVRLQSQLGRRIDSAFEPVVAPQFLRDHGAPVSHQACGHKVAQQQVAVAIHGSLHRFGRAWAIELVHPAESHAIEGQ